MTDGPFYPPRALAHTQRLNDGDWDADLTVRRGGQTVGPARGEHLALALPWSTAAAVPIDAPRSRSGSATRWRQYRHPGVAPSPVASTRLPGLRRGAQRQRRAAALSAPSGPVPYPGRTPHIHVKLRHASFGELTSQLFIAGDPGNARDFLWRRLAAPTAALAMQLQPAEGDGLRWQVRHALVVPA
jgi:protocatechuate 3,4-dioxygenase beta subunit